MRKRQPRLSYTVEEKQDGMPVKWAAKETFGLSTRLLRKLKDSDGVWINGKSVRLIDRVHTGDQVEICFPSEESYIEPEPIPLSILFEDPDLLVLDKQPGVVVHPTKGHQSGTLLNGILFHMEEQGEQYKPRLVNRLDRDTSGVLVVAKNSHAQDALSKQMRGDEMEKTYLAVVRGIVEPEEFLIDLPIGKEEDHHIHRSVCAHGDPSRTHVRVLERFPAGYTLVQLRLETGRTHQIRVHMNHLGHPVAADLLYGTLQNQPIQGTLAETMLQRQALHSSSITFRHPVSGESLRFSAPFPTDLEQFIQELRLQSR